MIKKLLSKLFDNKYWYTFRQALLLIVLSFIHVILACFINILTSQPVLAGISFLFLSGYLLSLLVDPLIEIMYAIKRQPIYSCLLLILVLVLSIIVILDIKELCVLEVNSWFAITIYIVVVLFTLKHSYDKGNKEYLLKANKSTDEEIQSNIKRTSKTSRQKK